MSETLIKTVPEILANRLYHLRLGQFTLQRTPYSYATACTGAPESSTTMLLGICLAGSPNDLLCRAMSIGGTYTNMSRMMGMQLLLSDENFLVTSTIGTELPTYVEPLLTSLKGSAETAPTTIYERANEQQLLELESEVGMYHGK